MTAGDRRTFFSDFFTPLPYASRRRAQRPPPHRAHFSCSDQSALTGCDEAFRRVAAGLEIPPTSRVPQISRSATNWHKSCWILGAQAHGRKRYFPTLI